MDARFAAATLKTAIRSRRPEGCAAPQRRSPPGPAELVRRGHAASTRRDGPSRPARGSEVAASAVAGCLLPDAALRHGDARGGMTHSRRRVVLPGGSGLVDGAPDGETHGA